MWCHSNQKALFVDCALLSSAPKLPSRLSNVLWVCRHSVNSKWSLYYIASTCGFRQLTLVCVVLLSVSNNTCDQLNTDGVTLFVFKGEASWLGAVALLYRKMLDFKSVSAAAWTDGGGPRPSFRCLCSADSSPASLHLTVKLFEHSELLRADVLFCFCLLNIWAALLVVADWKDQEPLLSSSLFLYKRS